MSVEPGVDAAPVYGSYQDLRRSLLSIDQVRELSTLRPAIPIRDTLVAWAWIIAAWTVAAIADRWWVTALAVVVVGNRFYVLFIVGHDGFHRRVLASPSANDLFCDVFVFAPIGAITRINKKNHLLHHQYLSTPDDPDRHKHACFNKATGLELIGYLSSVTSAVTSLRNIFLGREQEPTRDPARPRHTVRDIGLLAAWQLLLIGGLTIAFGWWGYPVMWLLAVFLFTFLADNFRTFAEHSHPEADEQADTHRLVTNVPNWLERQLLAPCNMHYHAAHHLWPSIPYYNLPAADAMMRSSASARLVTWRGSYVAYLLGYAKALPLEECRAGAARA